jgi:hypothetical protein
LKGGAEIVRQLCRIRIERPEVNSSVPPMSPSPSTMSSGSSTATDCETTGRREPIA